MEAVVARPDVAECAVIGVHDDLKGQIPRRSWFASTIQPAVSRAMCVGA